MSRTKIEKLEELIKECIVGELVEQKLEPLVAPGENFGSVIYKVDFKVENKGKIEIYNAVAKCTPPNKVTQELFNVKITFKAEIGWYTTVIPTIKEFQREHGVEHVDFFQQFYGARISLDSTSDVVDIDAVLLTENLKPLGDYQEMALRVIQCGHLSVQHMGKFFITDFSENFILDKSWCMFDNHIRCTWNGCKSNGVQGFKNVDRHVGFDLKTSKAILRDLATFHAVPIAIKLKNKDLFDKKIKPYLPGFQINEENGHDILKDIKDGLQEISEISPYMDKVTKNLDKNRSTENKMTIKEPWGSVCHNDFWINNIMIKEDNNPKTKFLDFQIPEYGSIANDVLFFLVVSVAQEVIGEHMDELIRYYWDEFMKNLQQLNTEHSSFTYEEFLKQIHEAASSGQFGHALFFTFLVLTDKGRTDFDSSDENFKKEDMENSKFTLNERHKKKYKWLVLEFVKRGWI